jgi:hypothetical protein
MLNSNTYLESFASPNKKDNEVFQSRYFSNSEKKIDNPEAYHSFFENRPVFNVSFSSKSSTKIFRSSSLSPISAPTPNCWVATMSSLRRKSLWERHSPKKS